MADRPLRICLLTYRGNPSSGGQGIYVRLLSQALRDLGHTVDVWSGQPYPELEAPARLVKVPSLDLWNEREFFRTPTLRELVDPINLIEWLDTSTGGFPEPLTFSRRVARKLMPTVLGRYDVIHDNQCLGPGLLELQTKVPVVATIHHPITVDRRIAFDSSVNVRERFGFARWYSFLPTQLRVSRKLDRILTVSEASKQDLSREYRVSPEKMRVVGNGINLDVFHPLPNIERRADHIITTMSSDAPLKGFRYLLDALAELRIARPQLKLTVVGQPGEKTDTRDRVTRMGLTDAIHFTGRIDAEEIARLYAASSVAVVPSLYEGFGFPAGEAMACEVPVVSTSAGALPEVVGESGVAGLLVEPQSGKALADAIETLLRDPARRVAMGKAGRARVLENFTWQRAAERTVAVYREALAERRSQAC